MSTLDHRPSPNHDERAAGKPVDILLLHYTGMRSAEGALKWLTDPASKVSSHYFVDEDGRAVALVDEDRRAWHAGKSFWAGETDINSRSIGIEIANPGHEFGYRPFPEAQIEAVIALCRDILARHPIPPERVLAHSDVAPARKQDPGEFFPWARLAAAGHRPLGRAGADRTGADAEARRQRRGGRRLEATIAGTTATALVRGRNSMRKPKRWSPPSSATSGRRGSTASPTRRRSPPSTSWSRPSLGAVHAGCCLRPISGPRRQTMSSTHST